MTYTQPLIVFFLCIALVGLLRLRHCRGKWLAIAGVMGLFVVSWPPVDWLLSRPLEARYPVRPPPASPPPRRSWSFRRRYRFRKSNGLTLLRAKRPSSVANSRRGFTGSGNLFQSWHAEDRKEGINPPIQ